MAVMVPRETLTDQRLSDLDKKVDEGFARVDGDIRELRGDVRDLRREMNERFESLNRSLIGAAVAVVVALIGSSATLAGIAFF
jgi:hypothetical protein